MPVFATLRGGVPTHAFEDIMSYPALYGITRISKVTFANFQVNCGGRDVALTLNPTAGDITHPVYLSGITKDNVDEASLLKYTIPGKK